MTDLKTIIMVMNTLERLYIIKNEELKSKEKSNTTLINSEIINYRKFLGFDDHFMNLQIKW